MLSIVLAKGTVPESRWVPVHDCHCQSSLRTGMAAITDKQMAQAEAQFKKFESMINSMTPVRDSFPEPQPRSPSTGWRLQPAHSSGGRGSFLDLVACALLAAIFDMPRCDGLSDVFEKCLCRMRGSSPSAW